MDRLTDYSPLLPKLGRLGVDSEKRHIEESRCAGRHAISAVEIRPAGGSSAWQPSASRHDDGCTSRSTLKVDAIDSVFSGPSLADAPYFPNQNQGAPARHIPPRVFIGLGAEDVTDAADIVLHHAMSALNP
jgi:hypothetical protein